MNIDVGRQTGGTRKVATACPDAATAEAAFGRVVSYTQSHWGTYEVERTPEGSVRIGPFAGDPKPSPIGFYQLDPGLQAMRVRRPSVRQGWLRRGPGRATSERGCEPFVEVPWDEALDLVAEELKRVRGAFGNASIFGGSYGWASAGRFHHAQSQLRRFLNSIGGFVRHVDSYSLGAANVVLPHIVAGMDELMDLHTPWDVLAENTELMVAFGGIPTKNAQVNSGGVGAHSADAGLAMMRKRGVRFVNVGPVRDNVGFGEGAIACEWLPCRPNTDTAVMLGLAHTLLDEDLRDRRFLDRCCMGFETFAAYLSGGVDGTAKTPEWAAGISGVPAATIRSLARRMASSKTMLNISWSLQRASHGEQAFSALVALAAMLGQIGTPGGGFGLGYGAINVVGSRHRRIKGPVFSQGGNAVEQFIPVARVADMLLGPGKEFTYNGGKHVYPDIRLVYWVGGNPFHHHQNLNRLMRAWQKPESIIVHEQYWTATAKRADIVLPATTSLERNDIGSAARASAIVAMKKAVEPIGEARDDFAIFTELARRLGSNARYDQGRAAEEWLKILYDHCRARNREAGVPLPEFAEFWEKGMVDLTAFDHPAVMLGDFVREPASHPLSTPSGKIEIFSETIASFGLDDCPGYPCWMEPSEWLGGEGAKRHPIHLLSDQPARRLHSQLDPSPHSRAGKIQEREAIYINPADAAARGIEDGQVVEVFNDRGRCLAGARLSDGIMPGVARLNTGAWFDPDPEIGLERHGNPNVLTLDEPASQLSQGCSAQTCLVEIRPFKGPLPEIMAFKPPAFIERPKE